MLASVKRSACTPAPPDGSDAAKVRTIGGDSARASAIEWGCYNSRILPQPNRRPTDIGHAKNDADSRMHAMKRYMCLICGWIYDEAEGAPEEGIPPGTRWEDLPPNWSCPECGARKEDFEMIEI